MGGITPGTFIFSGKNDWSPPKTLLPCWRFGYCTKIFRTDLSIKTMNATTTTAIAKSRIISSDDRAPVRPSSSVPASAVGRFATIPAKIINEIPLPTPRLVICSPSHMRKRVPPTRVTTVVTRKNRPGSLTTPLAASRPTAMPYPCTLANKTVR